MKTLLTLTACLFLAFGASFGECLQDQYGNKYNFTIDSTGQYVYGTVTNGQNCSGGAWPLIGSYTVTSSGTALELTTANPLGDASGCAPEYMLKGVLPNFQWYYSVPGEPQPGTWVSCSATLTNKPSGKGAQK
jgi:hypothetical protein